MLSACVVPAFPKLGCEIFNISTKNYIILYNNYGCKVLAIVTTKIIATAVNIKNGIYLLNLLDQIFVVLQY